MKFLHGVIPVYVEWIDSIDSSGWSGLAVENSDMRCVSVGLLLRKEKDRIILSQSRSKEAVGSTIEIPIFAIKRMRRLKV